MNVHMTLVICDALGTVESREYELEKTFAISNAWCVLINEKKHNYERYDDDEILLIMTGQCYISVK